MAKRAFDQDDQKKPSIPEQGRDQTLDSDEFPVPPEDAGAEGTSDEIQQTLDSAELPEGVSDEGGEKDTNATINQTVESTELPEDSPEQRESDTTDDDIGQTFDSVDMAEDSSSPAEAEPPDDGIGQTFDSDEFSPISPSDQKDKKKASTQVNIDQTVDLDAAEPADPGTGTTPEVAIDQTIETGDVERKGGSTFVEDGDIGATQDSAEIPDDATRQMSAVWGDDVNTARPNMTIKGRQTGTVGRHSTLVIQARAVRSRDDVPSAPQTVRADYDLLNLLGEGGMGVVYVARQASIDRTVAIKMLKGETTGDEVQRKKFLSEAVITGDLDHPNIVPIYDLGANESGALFYSMKRVQGTPWDERLYKMSLQENIEVLMKTADAVAFAHSRGVIPRDLKPENIMLGEYGEVLVMDWGLAIPTKQFKKSRNVAASTNMGGTPAYMAPEMATGPFAKIGEASDVYLMGAMLYECVTGVTPHTGKNVMKCLIAASKNVITPTKKKGELVDVALKAMSTKIEDRYASVRDFQGAIRQYLSHSESIALAARAEEDLEGARQSDDYQDYAQCVFGFQEALNLWDGNKRAAEGLETARLAYAQSALAKGDYDLSASLLDRSIPEHAEVYAEIQVALEERDARQRRLKTAKRAVVGLVALILMVVTVAFFAVNHQRRAAVAAKTQAELARDRAEKAEADAKEQFREAERQRIAAEMARAEEEKAKVAALAAEEQERKAREQEEKAKEEALAAKEEEQKAREAAEKAETEAVAAQMKEKEAREDAERAEKEALAAKELEEKAKAEAQYQAYIAQIGLAAAKIEENAFDTARELLDQCKPELLNWEWGRLRFLCQQGIREFEAGARLEAIDISPDGTRLLAGGWEGMAKLWTIDSDDPPLVIPHGKTSFVNAASFSPDGKLVVTGSSDQTGGYLRVWDAQTGKLVRKLEGHEDSVLSVTFSRDGKRLLTGSYDETARLWDVETGELIRTFVGHDWWVWSAAFSPDEQRIVTASHDGSAMVWSVETGEPIGAPFIGHRRGGSQTPIYVVAFSPDGQLVASGGLDNRVLIWNPDEIEPFDYTAAIEQGQFPSQKCIALEGHKAAVRSIAFSQDGHRIISGSQDNTVNVWDARSGQLIKTLRGHAGRVRSCRFAAADRLAVSGGHDGRVKFWDIEGYEEARVLRGYVLDGHLDAILAASFSHDGQQVVTASRDRSAKTWELSSGKQLLTLREGHSFTTSVGLFFPDGKRLLTSAVDNTVRIWDIATGAELADLRLTGTGLRGAVALSADGRWVLTGSRSAKDESGSVVWPAKLWDAQNGELLFELPGHKTEVTAVAISPDTNILFTGDRNGRCVLWDRQTGQEIQRFWDDAQINAAAFLADGKRLLTASNYKVVRQWHIPSGKEDEALVLRHPDSVAAMAISRDGRFALTSCTDGNVRLWDVQRAELVRTLEVRGGKSAFAQNLRRYMKDFRWDEPEVASQCGLAEALVSDLLAAKRDASPETAEKLARAFEVRPAELWKTIFSVDISPDGLVGMTVSPDDRLVRLWNLSDGREMRFPVAADRLGPFLDLGGPVHRGLVWAAAFSPQADHVITVGGDSARLWDVRKNVPIADRELMSFSPHGAVASAEYSPDGKYVVTGSWDNTVRVWDAATGQVVRRLGYELDKPQDEHQGRVNSAIFSPDGLLVVTASDDGTAKLWSTKDWTLVRTLSGHEGPILHAVFSHNGARVLTSSQDRTARVWDVATGEQVMTLAGHGWAVLRSAFSVNDQWVITGSADNTAIVWKLDGGGATVVHTLKGHTAGVTSVAFSPDPEASRILTGSEDYTAILWDARTGQEVLTLKGHTQEVTSVSFSPDGQYALTGSRDGTAIVWLTREWSGKEKAEADTVARAESASSRRAGEQTEEVGSHQ